MSNTYQIYLISYSTGETLDRIFLALKAQFKNIEYKVHSYSFTRTENQILKILEDAKKNENLSSKITLQPLKRFDLDAAIIFSDILMLPYGLNQKVEFEKGFGPNLEK